jgi:hypothetical protein
VALASLLFVGLDMSGKNAGMAVTCASVLAWLEKNFEERLVAMNCPRCQAPLAADARFCGVCGYSLPGPSADTYAQPLTSDATLISQRPDFQNQQRPQGAPTGLQPTIPVNWQYGQAPANVPAQPPPASWQQYQQAGYVPGTLPSSSSSPARKQRPKKRRRVWLRVLISLLVIAALLAGGWIFGLRPYLHTLAQSQLDQALTDAEDQIVLLQTALPSGPQQITATEADINGYLSARNTQQLTGLHMTILPTGLTLTFQAYGLGCTILAVPVARGGALQVTDVQVQGVLWLILSDDELTQDLNTHFITVGQLMHRSITAITLKNQSMDIQVS